MTPYERYTDNPTMFLSLTGYTREEFDAILPEFERQFLNRMREYRLDGKPRGTRRYVPYHNSPLPTSADKLFFILTYVKTYSLQSVHGALFGISQPKANQWIHTLTPVLEATLASQNCLPARKFTDLPQKNLEATLYWHDGTERPIQRPSDDAEQRQHYSGKKKQHTLKNNLVIDAECRIVFLTATVEGKKNDKKLSDESDYQLPPGSTLVQDTGFQGFELSDVAILQPKKKPKGKELTDFEKHINHWVSSLRIRVEHAIAGVKRYRIVKDRMRNWRAGFRDRIMAICCGLHNFRLEFRPWQYKPVQLNFFAYC